MKKLVKIIVSMLCTAVLSVPVFATACVTPSEDNGKPEHIDYASRAKLDLTSDTKKQEVTVKQYVDGDTTHFYPVANSTLQGCNNAADFSAESAPTKGYAKARYISINTPESTGQIEPFGKAASKFTRSKLEGAKSIIIESNDDKWNIDNTGERYTLWVWYMPNDSENKEYRNLNIEILQEGYAFGSGTSDADSRYREDAMAALAQAEAEKLVIYSGEKDPDYYYGGPINIDLKELRFNTAAYEGKKVVVEGTVVANFNNSAYIEMIYDDIKGYEETGLRIGMQVFYAYTTGKVLEILSVGNYVSVVGVVQYSEWSGSYQITDIKPYDRYNPDNANNCKLIETVGLDNAFTVIDPAEFVSKEEKVSVEVTKLNQDNEEYTEVVSMTYKEALLGSSVTVNDVIVYDVYTTTKEDSASKGAMTLYCRAADGTEFTVRTEVLKDADGNLITESAYINKTVSVKGVVEKFDGGYQIKCHRPDYITVQG